MSREHPPLPSPEQEPVWPSLEAIVDKINSFVDTRSSRCQPAEIKQRPDGRITQVCYTIEASDGSTAVVAYDWGSKNTTIGVAYFRGDPMQGDWLGGGGTLSEYDRDLGQWTDTQFSRTFKL